MEHYGTLNPQAAGMSPLSSQASDVVSHDDGAGVQDFAALQTLQVLVV